MVFFTLKGRAHNGANPPSRRQELPIALRWNLERTGKAAERSFRPCREAKNRFEQGLAYGIFRVEEIETKEVGQKTELKALIETRNRRTERVFLIGVELKSRNGGGTRDSLEELSELAITAGGNVIGDGLQ